MEPECVPNVFQAHTSYSGRSTPIVRHHVYVMFISQVTSCTGSTPWRGCIPLFLRAEAAACTLSCSLVLCSFMQLARCDHTYLCLRWSLVNGGGAAKLTSQAAWRLQQARRRSSKPGSTGSCGTTIPGRSVAWPRPFCAGSRGLRAKRWRA